MFLIGEMHGIFCKFLPGRGPHTKGLLVVNGIVVVVVIVVIGGVSMVIQKENDVSSNTPGPHFADFASYLAESPSSTPVSVIHLSVFLSNVESFLIYDPAAAGRTGMVSLAS